MADAVAGPDKGWLRDHAPGGEPTPAAWIGLLPPEAQKARADAQKVAAHPVFQPLKGAEPVLTAYVCSRVAHALTGGYNIGPTSLADILVELTAKAHPDMAQAAGRVLDTLDSRALAHCSTKAGESERAVRVVASPTVWKQGNDLIVKVSGKGSLGKAKCVGKKINGRSVGGENW